MSSVGIVGGGPAGLALAHRLSRGGHKVSLFEAAPELGGLARSFMFGDISVERYYHFLCGDDHGYFECLESMAMTDTLRWNHTKMGFFYNGKLYPFSSPTDLLQFSGMSLASRLRYGAFAAYCSLQQDWRRLDRFPAKGWLIDLLGLEAYKATWHPLLEIKFHESHDKISAAWVWHRVHRVARSRGGAFQKERLGYLEKGTEQLVDALVASGERHGAKFYPSTPVKRIIAENFRCVGLETANGEEHRFDQVVSAVPLPHFLRMAPELPDLYRENLESIDFIGVVCVVFRLRHSLTENYWLNVNDPRIPFNGCIEYTNLNPDMTPDGSTILYVPFYLPRGHKRMSYSDERNIAECLSALSLINPKFTASWVIDATVSRDPYAQVVCPAGFSLQVPPHQTPVAGLYLIESSQLFPADRTVSGTIDLANNVAALIDADTRAQS